MCAPFPGIADYALIGDSRSAALISNHGSIDWLCWPQFDSPSLFNRLLDHRGGGHFTIRPIDPFSAVCKYKNSTAVLVTEFRTSAGKVRVTDFMPVFQETRKQTQLFPFRSVIRLVDGIEGSVLLDILFRPRPNDGRLVPWFHERGSAGYFSELGHGLLHLATNIDLEIKAGELAGRMAIQAGQRRIYWLAYSEEAPATYPVMAQTESVLEDTVEYWKNWATKCTYQGPYRDAVLRSALTLKLLSFAPSGAIVAAPTTSLPEMIGGTRNWDYRYCWLRDASYTAKIFFRIGYLNEAAAFIRWLIHATNLTYPALQVVYDVYGEAHLSEAVLDTMAGYQESRPVRVGNKAYEQLQLDIYGELLDGLLGYVEAGHSLDREMRRRLVKMADLVCREWTKPDHSIWEFRDGPRHYVHSKVMCWVALDRAERIASRLGIRADVHVWENTKKAIRETVLNRGYSVAQGSFVQTLDGTDIDATSLIFAQTGFIDPQDPRVKSTIDAVVRTLGEGKLLYRYRNDDGLMGNEGAFLPCSFWLVETLAMAGRHNEAKHLFEELQQLSNDMGLYSEEIEPSDKRMLGNFPQALTHLAHIGAALQLDYKR
jgi:GH15 family glucan-1,4-alpha-glucosidase